MLEEAGLDGKVFGENQHLGRYHQSTQCVDCFCCKMVTEHSAVKPSHDVREDECGRKEDRDGDLLKKGACSVLIKRINPIIDLEP